MIIHSNHSKNQYILVNLGLKNKVILVLASSKSRYYIRSMILLEVGITFLSNGNAKLEYNNLVTYSLFAHSCGFEQYPHNSYSEDISFI